VFELKGQVAPSTGESRHQAVFTIPIVGPQYAAEFYRETLNLNGLIGSMGRRGNPYDNAKAESFIKTLKVEAVYPMAFEAVEDVAEYLPRFIEEIYNVRSRGMLSP
jgi:transposase InsO family protein